ncbi:circularly permuted type 2 ATP-grasp protein [Undibacterium sp. Di27W]|uniref:circularly permuted type 2 ATP-grasp protein n=1 Tax=Undibacterium sp. Di27W TaxID=3413036 RepID=UPI003BF2B86C
MNTYTPLKKTSILEVLKKNGRINLLEQCFADQLDASARLVDHQENPARLSGLGLRHEDKAIPYQGLPYVMSNSTFLRIGGLLERVAVIVERAIDLYLNDASVRDFFKLQARYEHLIRLGAAYRPRVQYCRYDFTIDDAGRPRIYELNTHSPAGSSFYERFAQVFRHNLVMEELQQLGLDPVVTPLEKQGAFAKAVIEAASTANLNQPTHSAAILNSKYLTMNNELDLIKEQFIAEGKPAIRCYVEDLRFEEGTLYFEDKPIDICFNKFDDTHGPDAYECAFSRTHAEVQAYLDAVGTGKVFAVNTFASMYLPENKSMLAFLWSPLLRPHINAEEYELIREVVPYTRLLRHLNPNELKHVISNRRELVLKRSLDTRGRSVVIGRDVDDKEWEQAIHQAVEVQEEEDFVIQELSAVETCMATLPGMQEPGQYFTSLAYFMIHGKAQGILVRTSAEATTNVAREGFVQPFLVVR